MLHAASPAPSSPEFAAEGVHRYDVQAVNNEAARRLYKARVPIYPKRVQGAYRRLKWVVMAATLAVYYILPWVRWPRGVGEPDQAVLVDFPGRRFYFFFIELWPDELVFLTGLLIIAALALFLATALFGRIWCGYACPQTVWTDLYIAVERLIEGDRNERIRLAKAPWSAGKIGQKLAKHVVWILIGAATGGAWIFYFHDAPTIFPQIFTGDAPFTAYFFLGLLTLTTYLFAGSLREQVCTYMCPWPRIQSALVDAETLQVTFKRDRGEPRGPHKKNEPWEGRGDCIDCKACVAACPMGIDIRDGAQLECINCALCIDACDEIMAKIGRPARLIGYDSDQNVARRMTRAAPASLFVRPRTILYAMLLSVIGVGMAYGLATRPTLELNAQRDRTPPFVLLADGSIRNAFTVKIVNKANYSRAVELRISADRAVGVEAVGEKFEDGAAAITAEGDGIRQVRVLVTAPAHAARGATFPLRIALTDPRTNETRELSTTFLTEAR